MRRLFMAALGFALGAALCAYLLTGWNRLLALVLLLAIGCIGVCFRKKIIFHRAACVLLAAAAAVCITSAYDAFYLSPMEEAAATQSEYQAQVMSESILYPSGWKSVELHVPLAGRTTKARVFYRSDEDYLPGDLLRFPERFPGTEGQRLWKTGMSLLGGSGSPAGCRRTFHAHGLMLCRFDSFPPMQPCSFAEPFAP